GASGGKPGAGTGGLRGRHRKRSGSRIRGARREAPKRCSGSGAGAIRDLGGNHLLATDGHRYTRIRPRPVHFHRLGRRSPPRGITDGLSVCIRAYPWPKDFAACHEPTLTVAEPAAKKKNRIGPASRPARLIPM